MKNAIITLLIVACAFLSYLSLTNDSSTYKEKLKALQLQYDAETAKRKAIDSCMAVLKVDFEKLRAHDSALGIQITALDAEVSRRKAQSRRSQAELAAIKADMEATRAKIKELESNPPNRDGDDLINSLNIKTSN